MPNNVATRLTFIGKPERVKELTKFVRSESVDDNGKIRVQHFDFDKIIPMPPALNIVCGSMGDDGMRYLYLSHDRFGFRFSDDDRKFLDQMRKNKEKDPEGFEEMLDMGRKYLHNLADYGATTWYDWCVKNWGTKWNAYDFEPNGLPDSIEFSTAWSFARPVVQKLSEMFPDIEIQFAYADEDTGSNTGEGKFIAGKMVESNFPESCTKRAYEIYISLHPGWEGYLEYDSDIDNYRYIDEE